MHSSECCHYFDNYILYVLSKTSITTSISNCMKTLHSSSLEHGFHLPINEKEVLIKSHAASWSCLGTQRICVGKNINFRFGFISFGI